MGEPYHEYQPNLRRRAFWRKFFRMRDFLRHEFLPGLGLFLLCLPLLLVLPIILLLAFFVVLPVILAAEAIDSWRRYCPVHKRRRFEFETFVVGEEEAQKNQQENQKKRQEKKRQEEAQRHCHVRVSYDESSLRVSKTQFPYANDHQPLFTRAGTHQRRYCSACRASKKEYEEGTGLSRVRELIDDPQIAVSALYELEALERRLGLGREKLEQVLDETMGNQKANNGDL